MKILLRIFDWIVRLVGSRIVDQRTGECAGKAIVVMWRGKVRLLGLHEKKPLYPEFEKQERETFWRRDLVFRSHPEPDFDSVDEDA